MKIRTLLFLFASLAIFACDKDTSDEFEEANGDVPEKYIKNIFLESTQYPQENKNITVSYDANNRVSNVTDGQNTNVFVYQDDKLATITGDGDPFNINELYQNPYDAFEAGEVLEYDSKGNPKKLKVIEEYFYGESEELIGELFYDDAPNPFFYTLKAAGIIDVMDNVKLNFSLIPQSPEIVRAKMLFPLNNMKRAEFKDAMGNVKYNLVADYVYNDNKYPITATFTVYTETETAVYTATYTYK